MIAFRRAQIAGSQAARVDNNFLHGNARIYHPDLQNVIAGSSQRVGRLNLADAILDRRPSQSASCGPGRRQSAEAGHRMRSQI